MRVGNAVRALVPSDRRELRERIREQVMVPARSAWRWVWTRRGVDVTATIASRSCLVVAPHPDDETLGCAVAVMRKRDAGTPVTVVIVSDGSRSEPVTLPPNELVELRKAEARRACARLGVGADDVVYLDFPDAGLSEAVDDVAVRLADLLVARAPEQVLVPVSCEGHPDHDATNEAARRALELIDYRGQVLEYAVWLWTHWPWTQGYGTAAWSARRLLVEPVRRVRERRPLLVDARGYRQRQREALAEHASQIGWDGEDGAAPVTGSLLATLRASHEVYLEQGSLRHLDFARPWRSDPDG
jgi:LmbE family N-acetylglucosaminyl deacetylase